MKKFLLFSVLLLISSRGLALASGFRKYSSKLTEAEGKAMFSGIEGNRKEIEKNIGEMDGKIMKSCEEIEVINKQLMKILDGGDKKAKERETLEGRKRHLQSECQDNMDYRDVLLGMRERCDR
jgi:hypothetical protein